MARSWIGNQESRLPEWEADLHAVEIGLGDQGRLSEETLPLPTLLLKNVSFALFPTQNFPGAGHLETFCDRLAGFGFSCSSSHGARRLSAD